MTTKLAHNLFLALALLLAPACDKPKPEAEKAKPQNDTKIEAGKAHVDVGADGTKVQVGDAKVEVAPDGATTVKVGGLKVEAGGEPAPAPAE